MAAPVHGDMYQAQMHVQAAIGASLPGIVDAETAKLTMLQICRLWCSHLTVPTTDMTGCQRMACSAFCNG